MRIVAACSISKPNQKYYFVGWYHVVIYLQFFQVPDKNIVIFNPGFGFVWKAESPQCIAGRNSLLVIFRFVHKIGKNLDTTFITDLKFIWLMIINKI